MIVVWRITERCNLACAFCAYDRRLRRSRREADWAAVERAPACGDCPSTRVFAKFGSGA